MKFSFLNTTREQSVKVLNGTLRHYHVRKSLEWANPVWKPCSSFSSMPRGGPLRICLPEGQTVNGAFYLEVLRLKRRVNRVRPAIVGNWKFHHDNVPSHTCSKVTDYLTQNGVATFPQTPYSPDLAPADFFLFPKVKSSLKGHHHGTLSAVKEACTRTLKDLPESAFQGAFES